MLPFLRYILPFISTSAALLIKLVLRATLGLEAPFLLFFVAIVVSAWFGGLAAGVLAAVLSTAFAWGFFLTPLVSVDPFNPNELMKVAIFLAEGIAVSALCATLLTLRNRVQTNPQRVRRSQASEQLLMDSVSDFAIFLLDSSGRIVDWTPGIRNLFGYSAEEIIGKSIDIIFTPEDQAAGVPGDELKKAHARGVAPDERWQVRKDGSRLFASGSVTPLHGPDGQFSGFAKILRDNTRQKLAEDALRKAHDELDLRVQQRTADLAQANVLLKQQIEERIGADDALQVQQEFLNAVLDSLDDGIVACDIDGVVNFMNRAAQQFYGVDESISLSSIASPHTAAYALYHTDEQTPVLPEETPLARALKGETVRDVEVVIAPKGGPRRRVLVNGRALLDAHGNMIGAVVAVHDISATVMAAEERFHRKREEVMRRYAEEGERRARLLSEVSAALVSSLDCERTLQSVARICVPGFADWCAVYVVDEGEIRRLGFKHANQEKTLKLQQLQRRHPFDPNMTAGVANVIRSGQPEIYSEITDDVIAKMTRSPEVAEEIKRLGFNSVIVVPLSARDHVLGAVALAITESDRRYDSKDLAFAAELAARAGMAVDNARLYRSAQEASRTKDEFLATVSHELRTPLTAMLGWVRMMRSGKLPDDAFEHGLAVIERNAKSQAKLVDDLLDVARIISGKLQMNVRAVDLPSVIEAAMESIRPAADAKKISLKSSLHPADQPLFGDPDRLQQVMWNLLSNAVKFTPPGGRVDISVEHSPSEATIRVSDTGRGISAEFLPYVFERFRQSESSITRSHPGLGLGLAIVRHLVELHGGTVSAESAGEGAGATFTVTLPMRPQVPVTSAPHGWAGSPPLAKTPVQSQGGAQASQTLSGLHVLLVEDEPDAREVIKLVLEQCGALVTDVSSVREALNEVENAPPDVLISDIAMPDEDGYSLMRKLRERGSRLPAAALTALAKEEDRARAMAEGFKAHLSKPVDPGELTAVVASLAGREDCN